MFSFCFEFKSVRFVMNYDLAKHKKKNHKFENIYCLIIMNIFITSYTYTYCKQI